MDGSVGQNSNNKAMNHPSSSIKPVSLAGFAPAAAPPAAPMLPAPSAAAAAASAVAVCAAPNEEEHANATQPSSPIGETVSSPSSSKKKRGRETPASTAKGAAKTPSLKDTTNTRKRGPRKNATMSSKSSENSEDADTGNNDGVIIPLPDLGPGFKPLTLSEIQTRLKALIDKLPKDLPIVPPDYNHYHAGNDTDSHDPVTSKSHVVPFQFTDEHTQIRLFASTIQVTIEEFNLLLSLVSSATYKWGVDRSGASQQNLGVLSAELQQCQEVIGSVVSSRLSNVLCPSVDIVVGEVEIRRSATKVGEVAEGIENHTNDDGGNVLEENVDDTTATNNGKKRKLDAVSIDDKSSTPIGHALSSHERRINHYTRPLVDPNYVNLCYQILARNAQMIRHVVASSIHSAQKVIGDYLKAAKKDVAHEDSGRGYAY